MTPTERKILQIIADQAGKSDFGAVNPSQLKPKTIGVTLETLNRAIAGLDKQGLIDVDEDAGTVAVSRSGREALEDEEPAATPLPAAPAPPPADDGPKLTSIATIKFDPAAVPPPELFPGAPAGPAAPQTSEDDLGLDPAPVDAPQLDLLPAADAPAVKEKLAPKRKAGAKARSPRSKSGR